MIRSIVRVTGVAILALQLAVGHGPAHATGETPANAAPRDSVVPSRSCVDDFERAVQPILNLKCVQCHQTAGPDGGLALQGGGTAERIVLMPSRGAPLNLIEPGRPDESYLFLKITGRQLEAGGAGARMPLIGPMLSEAQIDTIRSWIEGCSVAAGN